MGTSISPWVTGGISLRQGSTDINFRPLTSVAQILEAIEGGNLKALVNLVNSHFSKLEGNDGPGALFEVCRLARVKEDWLTAFRFALRLSRYDGATPAETPLPSLRYATIALESSYNMPPADRKDLKKEALSFAAPATNLKAIKNMPLEPLAIRLAILERLDRRGEIVSFLNRMEMAKRLDLLAQEYLESVTASILKALEENLDILLPHTQTTEAINENPLPEEVSMLLNSYETDLRNEDLVNKISPLWLAVALIFIDRFDRSRRIVSPRNIIGVAYRLTRLPDFELVATFAQAKEELAKYNAFGSEQELENRIQLLLVNLVRLQQIKGLPVSYKLIDELKRILRLAVYQFLESALLMRRHEKEAFTQRLEDIVGACREIIKDLFKTSIGIEDILRFNLISARLNLDFTIGDKNTVFPEETRIAEWEELSGYEISDVSFKKNMERLALLETLAASVLPENLKDEVRLVRLEKLRDFFEALLAAGRQAELKPAVALQLLGNSSSSDQKARTAILELQGTVLKRLTAGRFRDGICAHAEVRMQTFVGEATAHLLRFSPDTDIIVIYIIPSLKDTRMTPIKATVRVPASKTKEAVLPEIGVHGEADPTIWHLCLVTEALYRASELYSLPIPFAQQQVAAAARPLSPTTLDKLNDIIQAAQIRYFSAQNAAQFNAFALSIWQSPELTEDQIDLINRLAVAKDTLRRFGKTLSPMSVTIPTGCGLSEFISGILMQERDKAIQDLSDSLTVPRDLLNKRLKPSDASLGLTISLIDGTIIYALSQRELGDEMITVLGLTGHSSQTRLAIQFLAELILNELLNSVPQDPPKSDTPKEPSTDRPDELQSAETSVSVISRGIVEENEATTPKANRQLQPKRFKDLLRTGGIDRACLLMMGNDGFYHPVLDDGKLSALELLALAITESPLEVQGLDLLVVPSPYATAALLGRFYGHNKTTGEVTLAPRRPHPERFKQQAILLGREPEELKPAWGLYVEAIFSGNERIAVRLNLFPHEREETAQEALRKLTLPDPKSPEAITWLKEHSAVSIPTHRGLVRRLGLAETDPDRLTLVRFNPQLLEVHRVYRRPSSLLASDLIRQGFPLHVD